MIFDRKHGKVYVNISERAHEDLAKKFAKDLGVELVTFHAFQSVDGQDFPIYHTKVMMCLGDEFAVICLDAIRDETERAFVRSHLEQSGKTIIRISESQCAAFAGNMLNVRNANGESIIVMSGQAFQSLERQQIEKLEQFGKLLFSDLETIETCGGGSARCMMAEVFLEK